MFKWNVVQYLPIILTSVADSVIFGHFRYWKSSSNTTPFGRTTLVLVEMTSSIRPGTRTSSIVFVLKSLAIKHSCINLYTKIPMTFVVVFYFVVNVTNLKRLSLKLWAKSSIDLNGEFFTHARTRIYIYEPFYEKTNIMDSVCAVRAGLSRPTHSIPGG